MPSQSRYTSCYSSGNEIFGDFEDRVNHSMEVVKRILSTNRNPQIASPNHTGQVYDDKYTLSEILTNVGLTALCTVLDHIADGKEELSGGSALKQVKEYLLKDPTKSVTLRFQAKESCTFVSEEIKTDEIPISLSEEEETKVNETCETESSNKTTTTTTTTTRKIFNKVHLYNWKAKIEYEIYIFLGNETSVEAESRVNIKKGTMFFNITQQGWKENPLKTPTSSAHNINVPITFLLKCTSSDGGNIEFTIDRSLPSCRTPRQNKDIHEVWNSFLQMYQWAQQVKSFFLEKENYYNPSHLQPLNNKDNSSSPEQQLSLSSICAKNIFVPALPIFDVKEDGNEGKEEEGDHQQHIVLSKSDIQLLLTEHLRTLEEEIENLTSKYHGLQEDQDGKNMNGPFSSEAVTVLICSHIVSLCDIWAKSIDLIENMLRRQLYDAIGKNLDENDIEEFVRWHNKRFFSDDYAPKDFCYSIRRDSTHFPDGLLSIKKRGASTENKGNNATTFTKKRKLDEKLSMRIPINSAISVEFNGDIHLHAWALQHFGKMGSYDLTARARQFSGFLLLVGKVSGPNLFEPENGIILQNKDEILIPLILEEMPSATEFKDAIASLSPEQQRFAKSFRNMKLSSSLFGICVIQLKPQLELLLGLPEKSLTKEVELTQDLMSLFIDYQIPSDLLSYEGEANLGQHAKIEEVKRHVKHIKSIIEKSKEESLHDAEQKAKMREHQTPKPSNSATTGLSHSFALSSPAYSPASISACFGAAAPAPVPVGNYSSKQRQKARFVSTRSNLQKTQTTTASHTGSKLEESSHKSAASRFGEKLQIEGGDSVLELNDTGVVDFTMIPKALDRKSEEFAKYEKCKGDTALRSIIVKAAPTWSKRFMPNLLSSKMKNKTLYKDEMKTECNRAFDLLDALSRSGSLGIECAEMHIVVAACHSFKKSVVNTVVQDNINPIEKLELSNLLIASVIHSVPNSSMLREEADADKFKLAPEAAGSHST